MSIYRLFSLLGVMLLCVSLCAQDTVITNYPNSQQRWEKIFAEGKKTAENIYYADDTPWMTVQYDEQSAENWKWFHDNGKPYFEALIINDLLQGTYKIWYENGQLAEALNFKDNLENGSAIFYHSNGQLAMRGEYREGKMIDEWIFFDKDGNVPEGDWEWRFAASEENVRVQGQFQNGKPVGEWKYRTTANQGRSNQRQFIRVYD